MIRAAIIVFLVAALATAMLAITGEPGHANVVWLGWRADMTAAAFVLITLFLALSAMVAWRLLLWAAEAPRRAARARAAEYHIVNVATDDCAEPDRTGTAMGAVQGGMFGAAMAVGLIACFFCDACGSLAVELDRIAAPRAAVAS